MSSTPGNAYDRHVLNYARPYRSKRHPPCDQCRRKKIRCQIDGGNLCHRCQATGSLCTFGGLHCPSVTLPEAASSSSPSVVVLQPTEEPNTDSSPQDRGGYQSDSVISVDSLIDLHPVDVPSVEPLPTVYQLRERHPTQVIQTLDSLAGFSYQVIGASGESDPWLLRHCKFDDHGFLLSHQVHFRNAGGVPLDEKIPVHFLVATDELYESLKTTNVRGRESRRDELNSLVSLDCGQKLVALYAVPLHLLRNLG